jgi:hypothetical protein
LQSPQPCQASPCEQAQEPKLFSPTQSNNIDLDFEMANKPWNMEIDLGFAKTYQANIC